MAKRKMTDEERKILEREIYDILRQSVGWEYARNILESGIGEDNERIFMDSVIEDVLCSSAWEDEGYYNEDDIRLSIGREFIDRLDIQL